jgi:hypothetical protein
MLVKMYTNTSSKNSMGGAKQKRVVPSCFTPSLLNGMWCSECGYRCALVYSSRQDRYDIFKSIGGRSSLSDPDAELLLPLSHTRQVLGVRFSCLLVCSFLLECVKGFESSSSPFYLSTRSLKCMLDWLVLVLLLWSFPNNIWALAHSTCRDRLLFQYREGKMEMLANDYSRSPDLVRQVRLEPQNRRSCGNFFMCHQEMPCLLLERLVAFD